MNTSNDLRNDFEPGVDLNVGEAIAHSMADVVMSTELEPKREQSQGVLEGVLVPERDGAEETCATA